MRRALTIVAALSITGLLTAAVLAAPGQSPPERRAGDRGSPFGLLRDRPTELQPRLEDFHEQPVNPAPPLEPLGDLAPNLPTPPSRAVGRPWKGSLENGVQLPQHGVGFYTIDSALKVTPSRPWRRWGTDQNVARTMAVLKAFSDAHPDGPRIGVGDLSRPRGGPFGRKYGGLGHASHQNGLDIDVYYPRRDRAEKAPTKPSQVDRQLSQELVDRFLAAGAQMVFVGPRVGLRGPKGVVSKLVNHDNHLHVRWPSS